MDGRPRRALEQIVQIARQNGAAFRRVRMRLRHQHGRLADAAADLLHEFLPVALRVRDGLVPPLLFCHILCTHCARQNKKETADWLSLS